MVGKLLGQPTNTAVGRAVVLRLAGRVMERISAITGKEPMISEESAAIVTANIVCRSDKAMHELGYRPAPIETMLKDCIDWMVAENLIGPQAAPR
jgi:dihydroflavonol-4-reductase